MEQLIALFMMPETWISLATLTLMEVVLGIDNLVFVSILADRLPPGQRGLARKIGLVVALVTRLILLFFISKIVGLTGAVFSIGSHGVSWRDIIMLVGGLFLMAKGTMEIHGEMEGIHEMRDKVESSAKASFGAIIAQIGLMDVVFSFDSVITAVGMVKNIEIMVVAVLISMAVMILAVNAVSDFINKNPTVKMLALSFLLLIGVTLMAEGLHFHIPKGYLYFAIFFSLVVEWLNMKLRHRKARLHEEKHGSMFPPARPHGHSHPAGPVHPKIAGREQGKSGKHNRRKK